MKSDVFFILTAGWQDVNNKNVIRLHLAGPSGHAEVLVSNKPVFFIQRSVPEIPILNAFRRKQVNLVNFSGEPLDALYFNTQSDLRKAELHLSGKGYAAYESDVDPVRRFLMEKSVFASVRITGEPGQDKGRRIYANPLIEPADYFPDLKTASVDIETGGNNELYCIGIHFTGKGEDYGKVFMCGSGENTAALEYLRNEKSLLEAFFSYLTTEDPDIITGWHVIGFDLAFLEAKCRSYNLNFQLGRNRTGALIKSRRGGGYFASVPGRLIIDAPSALRSVYFSFDDFKLETVAQEVLGEGKLITLPGREKMALIDNYFIKDKIKLAEYNMQDAVLVNRILKKTGLLDLLIRRSILSGLVIDQINMMTAAFDHVYLPELHKKGFAAPDVKDIRLAGHAAGGLVMDPKPGIYENVIVLDFKSLYPSIIMTFKIDPLSRLMSHRNPISTPAGIRFSSTENILPGFIKTLMEKRSEAKKNNNKPLSVAIKLLMNSFYGVMGSPGCRFYHPDLPNAITGTGQWLLLQSKAFLEDQGYNVLYGDTDSLFMALKENEQHNPAAAGGRIASSINTYWKREISAKFNTESFLEVQYEKFYRKFIITPARGTDSGAKKRYAGLLESSQGSKLEFTGMESIRSDWTKLAKVFQAELYERIFSGSEVEEWIRGFVNSVRKGTRDDMLVYRKRIRKNINEYKNLPPQIRAAKMSASKSSVVRYVITQRGPVPVELEHKDMDYQHYIDKQLKPIADSVLVLLGKSFDAIINPYQFDMFSS